MKKTYSKGTKYLCMKNLLMRNGEQCFTSGKIYINISNRYIEFKDDVGACHLIGELWEHYFKEQK